ASASDTSGTIRSVSYLRPPRLPSWRGLATTRKYEYRDKPEYSIARARPTATARSGQQPAAGELSSCKPELFPDTQHSVLQAAAPGPGVDAWGWCPVHTIPAQARLQGLFNWPFHGDW
ncbi:hypothetical protein HaLaN_15702, partial [Haematococcus lacustris]